MIPYFNYLLNDKKTDQDIVELIKELPL